MSARKKWRLQLIPLFTYRPAASKVKAYEAVEQYRLAYAVGMSRVHHVNVQVDEGDGWVLYERIVFPAKEPA